MSRHNSSSRANFASGYVELIEPFPASLLQPSQVFGLKGYRADWLKCYVRLLSFQGCYPAQSTHKI